MKAKILFTRLDNEENLSEEELVFQIIPNTGDGVYTKNKWYLRVAVDLVRIDILTQDFGMIALLLI